MMRHRALELLALSSFFWTGALALSTPSPKLRTDTTSPTVTADAVVLKQNWWPVALEESLDRNRPNPIQLLNQHLVLFSDGDDDKWSCLADRCPHRFAPLSEGRIVTTTDNKKCLQCAYHGWEFSSDGCLVECPQASSDVSRAVPPIDSFPVQVRGGMVWVWADAASSDQANPTDIPVSALLDEYARDYPGAGFQRDLPYGYEILTENLLDVSHLPFSHHNAGGFDRDLARPMELRIMSEAERRDEAWSEATLFDKTISKDDVLIPTFEGKLLNASATDPTLLMFAKAGRTIPSNATSSSAFYAPSHIRYRRNRGQGQRANIELFVSPTTPGHSRVFLFTAIERVLERSLQASVKKQTSFFGRCKARFVNSRIRTVLQPNWKGHMVAHDIFDGDNVFLRQQAATMQREGLLPEDYSTPTTADVLVRAVRRWIDAAVDAKECVLRQPPKHNVARQELLDRYETHTANCPICRAALARRQRFQSIVAAVTGVLFGAVGASVAAAFFLEQQRQRVSIVAVTSVMAAWLAKVVERRLEREIQRFYFVDQVNADKK